MHRGSSWLQVLETLLVFCDDDGSCSGCPCLYSPFCPNLDETSDEILGFQSRCFDHGREIEGMMAWSRGSLVQHELFPHMEMRKDEASCGTFLL